MSGTLFRPIALNEPPVNYVQAMNAGTTTGNAVHFDSPTISQKGSGIYFIDAAISGTMVFQDVVTLTLLRDGTSVSLPISMSFAPGGVGSFQWSGGLTWIDVPSDGLPHSYRVVATAQTASNVLTNPIGGADFQVWEMGSA